MPRFPDPLKFLEPLLTGDEHVFPPGASPELIAYVESVVGPLPEPLRGFLLATDGASLFGEHLKFFPVGELARKDPARQGGWFDADDLFFAEADWQGGADFYIIRLDRPRGPVTAFSSEPSFVHQCADSFLEFMERMVEGKGVLWAPRRFRERAPAPRG